VKEYTIGVEVFGRGDSFDPRTDTIVRVQARRLRSKLEEFYDVDGATDGVVIELPKGGYVPRFRQAAPPPSRATAVPPDGSMSHVDRPERRLGKVRGLLGRDTRVVTLPDGGSHKTRLALQLALDGFEENDREWALRTARALLAYCDWSEALAGRRARVRDEPLLLRP
jgi:hypothetical protein